MNALPENSNKVRVNFIMITLTQVSTRHKQPIHLSFRFAVSLRYVFDRRHTGPQSVNNIR